MKSIFNTVLFLVFTFFLTSYQKANGQEVLQVTSEITPEEMVEMLIGTGLEFSNVVFTGAEISRGSFWGGPGNIGVTNGIILTSGSVYLAPGPDTTESAQYNNSGDGDDDLAILGGGNSYDACVLEFDFIPYYDHMWFQFVFGSEEYPEFVNTGFNDVFGFFLSGPGISGPYSNNSVNIALIPGTEVPVSIDNVNSENNSEYYVENDSDFIQYDGFTTVLTAESDVEPFGTYHIKLAIADILDHVFDSGVMLQANSFCSGPSTGTEEIPSAHDWKMFGVYPVPAGDVLNITCGGGEAFSIQLIGQDGRTWRNFEGSSKVTIDLRDIPQGLYILRITGNDVVETRKIFKR